MPNYTIVRNSQSNNAALVKTVKALLNEEAAYQSNPLALDETVTRDLMTRGLNYSNSNSLADEAGRISTRTIVHLAKKNGGRLLVKGIVGVAAAALPSVALFPISPVGSVQTGINAVANATNQQVFQAPAWMFKLFMSPNDNNAFDTIDVNMFLEMYRENFPEYLPRNNDWEANFRTFCGFVVADTAITDARWAAYLFATTMHEDRALATGWKATWAPVEETNGAGQTYGNEQVVQLRNGTPLDAQGNEVQAVDATVARRQPNAYTLHNRQYYPSNLIVRKRFYGRGYVQITHQDNYLGMDIALGQNRTLITQPERAAQEMRLAYDILSHGLVSGSYRGTRNWTDTTGYTGGHKLADFFNAATTDFTGARAIVNGDGARNGALIGGYGLKFKAMLEAAATQTR